MTFLVGIFLSLVSLIGMFLAYLYGRKVEKFRWSEYVLLLIAPVGGCFALTFLYGIRIVYMFVLSAVVGFIFEYSVGLIYHKTLNRRLWNYSRYSVGGYTSWLTLPMWGVAGIVFWLLSASLGL